ncbi:hypothetical protein Aca07nite_19430 [Actinoplanes capillaceus]|uniref:PASTA domain-containing protein n=1 Tax=Actinoplanes campanulatus TaxID=113559 RepID=A0ABQ3WFY8_9ACTN|nr:hypothetical protein [Actinoplanes capillaceus]GID44668.1 hypothetical protein Aca07nite_19430 [Actinoplanes capillaceus]
MTVIVQPSTQPDASGLLTRRVIGTAEEVAATVALLRGSGTLVAASVPKQLNPTDPRVTVLVRVRDLTVEHPARRPAAPRPWVKPLVIGGSILSVIAGLVVGGYLAAQRALDSASGTGSLALLGFLAVVGVLVLLVRAGRRKGACMGWHCPGCGHR